MSMALTIPSDRTQNILRWGVCFAVVLAVHVVGGGQIAGAERFC